MHSYDLNDRSVERRQRASHEACDSDSDRLPVPHHLNHTDGPWRHHVQCTAVDSVLPTPGLPHANAVIVSSSAAATPATSSAVPATTAAVEVAIEPAVTAAPAAAPAIESVTPASTFASTRAPAAASTASSAVASAPRAEAAAEIVSSTSASPAETTGGIVAIAESTPCLLPPESGAFLALIETARAPTAAVAAIAQVEPVQVRAEAPGRTRAAARVAATEAASPAPSTPLLWRSVPVQGFGV